MKADTPIKLRRRELGLRAEDVAAAAGVSYATVYAFERGLRNPSLQTARRVAAVLQTTVDALFPPDANGREAVA